MMNVRIALELALLLTAQLGAEPTALPTALPPASAPAPTPAPRPSGLGLADLERIAFDNNPTLAQSIKRFEQSRGRAMQAGAYPNPLLAWTGSSLGDQGTAGTQEGFFQQPIVTGGKIRVNRSRYEVDVEMARLSIFEQQMLIRNGVRLRYLQILALQSLLDLQTGLVRTARGVVETTRRKVDSGHASDPDLLMAENEAAELALDLEQLQQRRQGVWREVAAYLGCPGMAPGRLDGTLGGPIPDLTWDAALERLLRDSPEIRMAELQIQRQQLTLKREQIEPIPDLVVRGGAAYMPTSNQTVGYLRLYVEFPIWDRNKGNIHTAENGLSETRQDLDRIRLDLQRRLSRAYNHHQTSVTNVRRYNDEILPRARRAFELYLKSFRDEDASYSRVQSSQSMFAQASVKYLKELLELRRAQVAIDGLLLVEESIEPGTLRPEGEGALSPPGRGVPHQAAGGGVPVGRPSRNEAP